MQQREQRFVVDVCNCSCTLEHLDSFNQCTLICGVLFILYSLTSPYHSPPFLLSSVLSLLPPLPPSLTLVQDPSASEWSGQQIADGGAVARGSRGVCVCVCVCVHYNLWHHRFHLEGMQVFMHYITLPTAQEQKLGMEELERCLADVEETWEEMQQEVYLLRRISVAEHVVISVEQTAQPYS